MQPASRAMMVGANRRALHPSIRDRMSNDPKMICAGVCVGKCPVIHTLSQHFKTLTEKPTDAWHARMTISLWSLWMIPYLLHVPPVLIIRIIIIIIISHTRLVGNCRAGTPHIHTVDIVMFWTTVLPSPHVFGTVCVYL